MKKNKAGSYMKKSMRKADALGKNSVDKATTLLHHEGIEFCEKVRERLNSSCDYLGFLKCIHACSIGKMTNSDLRGKISGSLSKYPDLINGFNDFLKNCEDVSFSDEPEDSDKIVCENLNSNSNSDSDPEVCGETEIVGTPATPSYHLLPVDYPVAMASERSELDALVLNDSLVCRNRNYYPKRPARNKYERALDRCEDHQFELHALLNKMRLAAERVEELVDGIEEGKIKINLEAPFRIEDHLSVLNLRCIERLYDGQGYQILETLNKNPKCALPVILSRLKEKVEEIAESGSDLNKVWTQVYAKNHHKSLEKS